MPFSVTTKTEIGYLKHRIVRKAICKTEMFEAHQPSASYFGHFHINRDFSIGETKFRCLAEMFVFDVLRILSAVGDAQ
jgi:hypothetical protein